MDGSAARVESWTRSRPMSSDSDPNAATGSIVNEYAPPLERPCRAPETAASRLAAATGIPSISAAMSMSTGAVTPDRRYSTLTAVDHGHC